jgi:tetratricopeptide (TPR) repeat protein
MFEEAHENLEELRRLFAGQMSPVEAERVAAHLASCRECWLLATRAMAAQQTTGAVTLQPPLGLLVELHEVERARLEEGLEAQALWANLRSLSTKARRDRVRLTRSLHTLGFLGVLLAEGATSGPSESEELFYLAVLVAGQLPFPKFSVELKHDLCAESYAGLANAHRRLAKWPAAREALKRGTEHAARGLKKGVVEGTLLCVEGALAEDLGNSLEAAGILRRAQGLFEKAEHTFLRSRTFVQLAYVLVDLDPTESLRAIEQASSLIHDDNQRLTLFAEGIKIDCLLALGSTQEALLRFNVLKRLHEQFREPFIQLRVRFTAALILEHLGRSQKAASLFQEVIAGDLEHGLVKDFFLDLVYLFGFYLRRGQTADAIAVCRRAGQELSLLEDEEGSGEPARDQMREVWRSLEEEVRKGKVGLGATTVLRNYIKAHWRTPASEPPSFQSEVRSQKD